MYLDFALSNCCDTNQKIAFLIISICIFINTFLWGYKILEPFKLLTVFLHEFSHASACWLSGGSVKSIEVNKNHGGTTVTSGGNPHLILPAGYIGSCFYGMFFILSAYINKYTLLVSTTFLCFLLLLVLVIYANSWFLRGLCLFFLSVTISIWIVCELYKEDLKYRPLQAIMMYIGVLNEMYSMVDIVDDLICRSEHESDAYKYAELTRCNSKFCGCLWFCINLCFIVLTFYLIGCIHVDKFY
ncbi:peptidase, putative [Hepatocystis sp. ex Piliocolobus tephrosceles]|nr:peptidase, putative [Hepatocystis sp. ex Piliocolobus tephrosceles]